MKAARAQTKPGLARARFQGEIAGLRALRTYAPAGGLTVPEGLGLGGERSPIAVLEWVGLAPFGLWVPGAQAELGKAVATLHTNSERAAADATGSAKGFGFGTPTYLGECALQNAWNPDWVSFFVHSRLVPRLDEALLRGASFYGTSNEIAGTLTAVAERIIDVGRLRWALFSDIEPVPALVHGDIFSGNCGVAKSSRECVLFDPAAYFGHSEVDLAVSTLFGRFSPEFYDAYHEVRPKEKGFEERRVLYRFYYLLNLLVRHGAGYGPGGSTQDPRGYFEMCCEHGKELMEILK